MIMMHLPPHIALADTIPPPSAPVRHAPPAAVRRSGSPAAPSFSGSLMSSAHASVPDYLDVRLSMLIDICSSNEPATYIPPSLDSFLPCSTGIVDHRPCTVPEFNTLSIPGIYSAAAALINTSAPSDAEPGSFVFGYGHGPVTSSSTASDTAQPLT
ncbi:hypothetical protein BN946_scf184665.g4 [Trametes cinnabarina]|uniref:Uncharacterized protein n=1 Tax=Pycnoporus cinnabarinus TaxID=5643 RepID=A0A060SN97_PYCCI|nr:hypothetical protein BN946_scf184665.g4 [Trametes cinnabarina]